MPRTLAPFAVAMLAALLPCALPCAASAQPRPSSDLLLPYFEVDLTGYHLTTVFTLTNSSDEPVPVQMTVHSNWGIPMEEMRVTLGAYETRGFNLRDWLLLGELPRTDGLMAALSPRRLSHLHSALSGQRSAESGFYYGTEVRPDLAVGYVTLRIHGKEPGDPSKDVLWGNYFVLDPEGDAAQGDILVDIDSTPGDSGLCRLYNLFFLEGSVFDGGTEVIVWTPHRGSPSVNAAPAASLAGILTRTRNQQGEVLSEASEDLLATQTLRLEQIAGTARTGSLELRTLAGPSAEPVESFVAVRYRAENRYSATLRAWCLDRQDGELPTKQP